MNSSMISRGSFRIYINAIWRDTRARSAGLVGPAIVAACTKNRERDRDDTRQSIERVYAMT
jgi:hypothetical protein